MTLHTGERLTGLYILESFLNRFEHKKEITYDCMEIHLCIF